MLRNLFLTLLCCLCFLFLSKAPPTLLAADIAEPPLYKCYPQVHFELCIPSISKGHKIVAILESASLLQNMEEELLALLPSFTQDPAPVIIPVPLDSYAEAALKEGEKALLKTHAAQKIYDVSAYFPAFIANNLNKSAGYAGPNCYNTALITSGILSNLEVLYSSIEELEFYLKYFFEEIKGNELQFGDLILYDAYGSKLHASVYLFNGLVFHKKGFHRYYYYRIIPATDVFKKDAFEWIPNPGRGEYLQAIDPTAIDRQKRYFRLRKNFEASSLHFDSSSDSTLSKREVDALKIIDFLKQNTLLNLKQSQVGTSMGFITETLSNYLQSEFSFLNNSNNLKLKLYSLRLKSLADQIFQSIEAVHFTSPYVNYPRVLEQICWHNNQYTRELVKLLFNYLDKSYDEESLQSFILGLNKVKRSECNLNLLQAVREFH
ncbi:MAG: hypothetical protein HQK50_00635 [Oligoflexia bacterium]|nr:hypothetical protein [Oligoflexia bacterium]